MPSITKTLIAATVAVGLSGAAPAPAPWVDCKPGTFFVACQQTGYAGCCSKDACAYNGVCPDDLPPTPPPSSTPIPTPSSTPSTVPTPPAEGCGDKRVKDFRPNFHTFWRDEPKRNSEIADSFSVSQEDNRVNKINQAVVFGLPKNATRCHLDWYQKAHTPGFTVTQTGFTQVFNLNLGGLPWDQAVSLNGNNVTWEVVEKLMPEKRMGSADFTFWDTMDTTADHSVGAVECPTDTNNLAFLVDLDGGEQYVGMKGSVTMPQTKESGWYLSYCPPEQ